MSEDTDLSISIPGWEANTGIGTTVWVGYYEEKDMACFKFTAEDGTVTRLAMSPAAARVMLRLIPKSIPTTESVALEIRDRLVGKVAEALHLTKAGGFWKRVDQDALRAGAVE